MISAASQALSDSEVIQRVLAGETALFEIIMRRYNQRLFRLLRALLRRDEEAEEALQETYLRAYEHLGQFQQRARFSTWLTRIALNEAQGRIRRQRRRRMDVDISILPLPDDSPGGRPPEQRAATAELRDAIAQALEALPQQLRSVLVLRAVEGLGPQETAACLGITATNANVRLHRARREMRRRLAPVLSAELRQLYAFDGVRCDRIVNRVLERIGAPAGEH